jgi:N6-adenosine-specific RNA methylase IME4
MGRPRQYATQAARQAAYRQRHRITRPGVVRWLEDLIAQGARFGTVYADVPWRYSDTATTGAAARHYPTMSLAEIAALPVAKLVADHAHLHFWTTTSFLWDAKPIMEAWGFTPKSQLVWCKPRMGTGHFWRVSHEILLLGVKGRAPFRHHGLQSWFTCGRGAHSDKPDQVRHWIESASPGPYLELFGRRPIRGWTVMGNDIAPDLFAHGACGGASGHGLSPDVHAKPPV